MKEYIRYSFLFLTLLFLLLSAKYGSGTCQSCFSCPSSRGVSCER